MRCNDWLWALASMNMELPITVLGLPDQGVRSCRMSRKAPSPPADPP